MFDVKVAEQFMRRELITLRPNSEVLPSVSALLDSNISGAPVIDESGLFLGVFSEKCCLNALTRVLEYSVEEGSSTQHARDFMKTQLVTLTPDWDVFAAIDHILGQRISGAPVVDANRDFLGIFSEKTAMRVLMAAIHDSVPGTKIEAYMNLDRNRVIEKEAKLIDVAHKFQETPYRRLPVLAGNRLLGQVSRRDVLRAAHKTSREVIDRAKRKAQAEKREPAITVNPVNHYMDQLALTIKPTADLLTVAQLFLNSPYRRLPVVDEQRKLIGQVSRRDLLQTASALIKPQREKQEANTLYLSQVADSIPASIK